MTISKMKQNLSLMLVLLLLGSFLTPTVGNAADADLTAQQKYDALAAKGIFAGINGEAALDQNMNRSQFARVAALILGLEGIGIPDTKVVTEAPFSDVKVTHWAAEEITAVKEEGLFNGYPNGTFNPSGDVSVQELAVVVAGILDLEPVQDAEVEGAADWAAGYIKAIVDAGIDFPTNYTEPSKRADLVALSYAADTTIIEKKAAEEKEAGNKDAEEKDAEEKEKLQPLPVFDWAYTPPANTALAIYDAKQVGPKIFQVTFNKNIDPATIQLTVTRNGQPVDIQAVPYQANGYRLTLAENVPEGDNQVYTVTASYTDTSTLFSSRELSAHQERIAKIEFVSASDTVARGDRIGVLVKALNQFGEPTTDPSGLVVTSTVPAVIDHNRMVIELDTSSESLVTGISVITITVYDDETRVQVTKNFRLGTEPIASKFEFRGSLRDTNGQEVSQAQWTNTYHLNFDVYDQYGHMMLYPLPSGAGSILTSFTPDLANVSIGALSEAPANEPGTLSLPITFGQSGPEEGRAYTFTLNVGSTTANQTFDVADSPVQILATPSATPAGGAVVSGTPVSLSAAVGAAIYYTTDGSVPTTSSSLYTGPIVVNSAMTIKAIAVQDGMQDSDILEETYTINLQETALNRINEAAESGDWDNVAASTFADAGVEGVTASNVTAVKAALIADGTAPWTLTTIQSIVNAVIDDSKKQAALDLINEAAESGEWAGVTETTFASAGITGITSDNLAGIQSILQDYDYPSRALPKTSSEIQAIIAEMDNVAAIFAYLESSGGGSRPTVEVFGLAGITGVDAANLDGILDELELVYWESRSNPFATPMSSKQHIQDAIDIYLSR
jgi:hypothetical protein